MRGLGVGLWWEGKETRDKTLLFFPLKDLKQVFFTATEEGKKHGSLQLMSYFCSCELQAKTYYK